MFTLSKPAFVLESEAKTTPSLVLIPIQYVMVNSYLKNSNYSILNYHSYYRICAFDKGIKLLRIIKWLICGKNTILKKLMTST